MEFKKKMTPEKAGRRNKPRAVNSSSVSKHCGLLQMPREIRDQILISYFSSVRLTYGRRVTGQRTSKTMQSTPNVLAILYTCRQINEEARDLWLDHILFNFESPEAMLDRLTPQPPSLLSRIRYMRLVHGLLILHTPWLYQGECYYGPAAVMMLLPDLRLNRFTLLAQPWGAPAYQALRELIKAGCGWKELHYITPDSSMLGFDGVWFDDSETTRRRPQPAGWTGQLKQRDGTDSGASVVIYRSGLSDAPGSVLDPLSRSLFLQKTPSDTKDKTLISEKRELLVIVKRGLNAVLSVPEKPVREFDDIRSWSQGMDWPEIREECMDLEGPLDEVSPGYQQTDLVEIDDYGNVDDYEWPFVPFTAE